MIATFTALLLAHVLADFVLQTNWIAANKHRPGVFALHILIVFAAAALALGQRQPEALGWLAALAVVHGLIDLAKRFAAATGFAGFVTDQVAHLASLAGLAALMPGLWASGLWATLLPGQTWLLHAFALVAGFVIATRAGGFAVGALLGRFDGVELPQGLEKGGELIGLLERAMIFLLVLAGEPAGIGFLIAAKSVLRLEATFADGAKHHRAAEYIIIGTLASFAWAMAASFATVTLRATLTP
ncbi:DUF3307 domain-containing protein [Sinisalibacter aestuarii]|uniref:DUF3307 domain-containing protein n=1 Tax=Sinisalibacter aestuarii TaxID=2949426 RepID=A0ABQ5LRE9_9RHOB|nr:DUF3307 domain-containing protein [Sinisalibacter aestuarii]GKY87587.1 hypothetical protein STA1M1_14560 [Sinisalibacter aestuarii]